jgi:hypothetical protein
VAVLVVSIIALRHPRETLNQAGTDTRTATPSTSVSIPPPSRSGSRPGSTSNRPKPNPPSSTKTKVSAIGSQPLIVLNDTSTPNLARQAANRFEGGGWNITSFDENYSNVINSTVAYYDPSIAGAQRAAQALQRQYPTIKRVAPRFAPEPGGDPLPPGPVVVVLTDDYAPG